MSERILVNCALPYANGPLHLGHIAGAYLAADIFVRFNRLNGNEVLFVSGSDEYGTPITITAEKNKTSPQNVADIYHREHEQTFKNLDIVFDIFTRTTDPEHVKDVDEFFINLLNKNYLEKRYMVSPYCKSTGKFMPDRYIHGTCPYCGFNDARGDQCDECGRTLDPIELINPRCTSSNEEPLFIATEHFFLRLDLLSDELLNYLNTRENWKPNVINFTRSIINEGLRPRPITRDIDWGVPIPLNGFEGKRIYVWFEALIGYITGARVYSKNIKDDDYWKKFWLDKNVKSYYFIGKDNIPFHTIIWPAMLIAHGDYNLPYNVPANEYLRFEGAQFSKSRGIGYTVNEALSLVNKNYLRYYMASIMPETGDSSFSLNELVSRVNSELIDKYGNFIYRVLGFISNRKINIKKCEPDSIINEFKRFFDEYSESIKNIKIKNGLQIWLEAVTLANNYFNSEAPWNINDPERLNQVLFTSLKISMYLTAMLYPYVPSASSEILSSLGFKTVNYKFDDMLGFDDFRPLKGEPPFKKLEIADKKINIDLMAGTVKYVNDHPNADNLYVLGVHADRDITIVSNIKKYLTPENLQGRRILLIRNVKPATIRGIKSEAIIIAVQHGERIIIPEVNADDGSRMKIDGFDFNGDIISMDEIKRYKFIVDKNELVLEYNNSRFIITENGKPLKINAPDGSSIVL
ncbi:methionine--tRNA ligase [Picrophilus oshimae]|uniref:Methionine--tRNA ligase n=1 Tax=Picrophilus torridus (strain ATCC 700027 / DSM 9790 / JCM 10055 / NBRC 100828 / KAW 2/3) TaxID=1122961 RepID=A0A8G2L741_PICTO|nr:methionine--tRNA ligase [Picrophilus oshimae]SMD30565.1 methionyl-tRNA synthetase [Picrophilus oshimae DSM 9789]